MMLKPFSQSGLRRRFDTLPLRQRVLLSVMTPMIVGFVALAGIGLVQQYLLDVRLAAAEQAQELEFVIEQMQALTEETTEDVLRLAQDAALQLLLSSNEQLASQDLSALQRDTLNQQHDAALDDLSRSLFDLAYRAREVYDYISFVDANGAEVVRVNNTHAADRDQTFIVPFSDLQNQQGADYFETARLIPWGDVDISALTLAREGDQLVMPYLPVLRITTPVYFRGAFAGAITARIRADSLLDVVRERVPKEEEHVQHYILVDAAGNYLVDTRETLSLTDADYQGHLFGLERGVGGLAEHDPDLSGILANTVVGANIGDQIVSATSFSPFAAEMPNTPWTLISQEGRVGALKNVPVFGAIFALAAGLMLVVMLLAVRWIGQALTRPIEEAALIADRVANGDLTARVPVRSEDEIGRLGRAVNAMTTRLLANLASLEERFVERTRDLEVASEIAGAAVGVRDLNVLLDRTVNLIRDRFGFYHVQVFLVDDLRQNAVLVASTGEAGKTLLDLKWSLPVGSYSVIGQVTAKGENVIALDTEDAAVVHRPNPYLPDTRSEMALPLRLGDEVIGALDIQSKYPNAFGASEVRIFELLTRQLAIAINSARLLAETNRQIQRVEDLNRQMTRQAWEEFKRQHKLAETFTAEPITATGGDEDLPPEATVTAPILVRGEPIGVLNVALPGGERLAEDERALIDTVVERVALAVENARLVQQTKESLAETESLYEASSRLSRAQTVQEVAALLAEETGRTNAADRASVILVEGPATFPPQKMVVGGVWSRPGMQTSGLPVGATLPPEVGRLIEQMLLASGQTLDQKTFERVITPDLTDSARVPDAVRQWAAARGVTSATALHIHRGEQWFGLIFLEGYGQADVTDEENLRFLQALADQAAIAIDNQRLFQQTQDSLAETERLYQASRAITAASTTDELILAIHASFGTPERAIGMAILSHERDAQGESTRIQVKTYGAPESSGIRTFSLGTLYSESLDYTSEETQRVLILDDPARIREVYAPSVARLLIERGVQTLASLPLLSGNRLLGYLLVLQVAAYEFSQREIEIFQALAGQVATVLRSRRLFEEVESERQTLQSVLATMPTAVLVLDAPTRRPLLANAQAVDLLGADADLDDLVANGRLLRTDSGEPYPLEEIPAMQAIATRGPAFAEDLVLIRANGQRVDVLSHAAPIIDAEGNVVSVIAVFEDITELRELQSALQETLRETTAMYESSKSIFGAGSQPEITDAVLDHLWANLSPDIGHLLLLATPTDEVDSEIVNVVAAPTDDMGSEIVNVVAARPGSVTDEPPYPPEILSTSASILISDCAEDERLSSQGRARLSEQGIASLATIPLLVGGETIGWLALGFRQPYTISPEQHRFLEALADQAAVALQNVRLKEQTEESLSETLILFSASRDISRATTVQDILDTFISFAMPPNAHTVSIFLRDDTPGPVQGRIAALWCLDDEAAVRAYDQQMIIEPSNNPFLRLLDRDGVMVLEDIQETDIFQYVDRRFFPLRMPHGVVLLPMVVGRRRVGSMLIGYDGPHKLTNRERRIYQSLADQVATAVENRLLLQQTQDSLEEARTLYQLSSSLVDVNSAQGLLQAIVTYATHPATTYGQLVLLRGDSWDAPGALLDIAASWSRTGDVPDLSGMRFTAEQYPGWQEVAVHSLLAIDDVERDPRLSEESRLSYLSLGLHALAVIPLTAGERPIGAILLGSAQARPHSERELRIYRSLSELATISLENTRLLEQTQRRARQLQTSAQISRAVTSILDLGELLPQVVNLIHDNFGYDHVQVFLINEDGTQAVLKASTGEAGQKMLDLNWALDVNSDSVIGQVTARAEPIIAQDTSDSKVAHRPNPYLPDTRSEMALPLLARGHVLGALDVQSNQDAAFSQDDMTVLASLADQIAVALDNARLFQESQEATHNLEEQVRRLENLYATSAAFTETLDATEILSIAARSLVQTLHFDHCVVALLHKDDPTLSTVVAEYPALGAKGMRSPLYILRDLFITAETPTPLLVKNIAELPDDMRVNLERGNFQTIVLIPLLVKGQIIGGIGLNTTEADRKLTPSEITLIQTISTQAALAYDNAQLFAQAQRQAEEMRFLFDVTTAATAAETLELSMGSAVAMIRANVESDAAAIFLPDERRIALRRVAVATADPAITLPSEVPLGTGLFGEAAAGNAPLVVADFQKETRFSAPVTGMRSMIAVPMFAGTDLVGLLVLLRQTPGGYGEGSQRLLQALSGSLGAVIQNIRLLDEVKAANERLREIDKLKSQFLANMSHELRTPLNSIIGFSRVILKGIDGPLTDMQKQDLETIHSSGQHLLNLINDILDQSKIEAGKMELNIAWFDIHPVIEVARSMAIGLLKDKPIRLNVELEPDLPQVWGDEVRTRQVLINLVSNANKFTREGSITIAAFRVEQEDGPYVEVSVTDTGIGIPQDKQDIVFQAFEQIDGSLTRTTEGTGLGLPISKYMVEKQGGQIWVESTENVGSTFSFTIPAYQKASPDEAAKAPTSEETRPALITSEQPAQPEAAQAPRKVILVIDDEVGMHQMYRRYLNKAGYIVEATSDPSRSEDLAVTLKPDLIILDVRMPRRDGWEVLERLKDSDATFEIPVIVCSIDPDAERGYRLGAADYLVKPFLEDELLAAIRRQESERSG